jgi:carbonic anhydrase/acetyltransferase-like protein (isoleucine patch superfamily)
MAQRTVERAAARRPAQTCSFFCWVHAAIAAQRAKNDARAFIAATTVIVCVKATIRSFVRNRQGTRQVALHATCSSRKMGCTNIQDFPIGHVSRKTDQKPLASSLIIGDYVTIGHGVILHGCEIGNECLIGMGSIVMDDVKVSSRVMIGAGSLIPPEKVLEGGFLYVGRPAEKVAPFNRSRIGVPQIFGRTTRTTQGQLPSSRLNRRETQVFSPPLPFC